MSVASAAQTTPVARIAPGDRPPGLRRFAVTRILGVGVPGTVIVTGSGAALSGQRTDLPASPEAGISGPNPAACLA
jgi:hypothetical protein